MDDIVHLFDNDAGRNPWPHQLFAVTETIKSIEAGEASCVTSPTGSGKSAMLVALLRWCAETKRKAILYTNRRMLTDQTMRILDAHGIYYGVIAATHRDRQAILRDIQLASIQTIHSRVYRKQSQELFKADVVFVDEAHVQSNGVNEQILKDHEQAGAVLVGFTATPLGVANLYPHLIIAGRNSDCRQCGALVPASIYAPFEMDTSSLKIQDSGEFNYVEVKKACFGAKARHAIIGRVYDHWRTVNPDARPTIGFAPGVAESKWFVEEFAKHGVRCAHIDGNDCYIDGEEIPSNQQVRDEILAEAKAGQVAIVWNRFVLREGIDAPFLYHAILATPFGSMMSYIQSVGRALRYSEETPDRVIVSDHGGNWWRHPSPNADFNWQEWYFHNPSLSTRMKMDAMRERRELSPIACERCGGVRTSGRVCPYCGHVMLKKHRAVIQRNGTLKQVYGEPLPRKIVREKPDTYQKWRKMYHRMKKADMSFAQAIGLFVHENGYWPPDDMPLMPKQKINKFSKIRSVADDKLISVEEHIARREEAGMYPVQGVVKQYTQHALP